MPIPLMQYIEANLANLCGSSAGGTQPPTVSILVIHEYVKKADMLVFDLWSEKILARRVGYKPYLQSTEKP